MALWIELPQFKMEKVNTPYPAHRNCAHLMIRDDEARIQRKVYGPAKDNETKGHFEKWTMVHGFIYRNRGGKKYIRRYAWLQKGSKIYDVQAKTMMTKAAFYKEFKPTAVLFYTFSEVRENMRAFRRYGRWVIEG